MEDLKMDIYDTFPTNDKVMNCSHCEHKDSYGNETSFHLQKFIGVRTYVSEEFVSFRNRQLSAFSQNIITECDNCGRHNLYPLTWWTESMLNHREHTFDVPELFLTLSQTIIEKEEN